MSPALIMIGTIVHARSTSVSFFFCTQICSNQWNAIIRLIIQVYILHELGCLGILVCYEYAIHLFNAIKKWGLHPTTETFSTWQILIECNNGLALRINQKNVFQAYARHMNPDGICLAYAWNKPGLPFNTSGDSRWLALAPCHRDSSRARSSRTFFKMFCYVENVKFTF